MLAHAMVMITVEVWFDPLLGSNHIEYWLDSSHLTLASFRSNPRIALSD